MNTINIDSNIWASRSTEKVNIANMALNFLASLDSTLDKCYAYISGLPSFSSNEASNSVVGTGGSPIILNPIILNFEEPSSKPTPKPTAGLKEDVVKQAENTLSFASLWNSYFML